MTNDYCDEVDAIFLIARHGESAEQKIEDCVRAAAREGDRARARHWRRVRRVIARRA